MLGRKIFNNTHLFRSFLGLGSWSANNATLLIQISQMGRVKTEHCSPTSPFGKKPFYKTYPFHQTSLRTKGRKRRQNFTLPIRRRRSSEEGLRMMDLLRSFYTMTQVCYCKRLYHILLEIFKNFLKKNLSSKAVIDNE